jgi:DNA-binding GntR family transcriptional regulator
VIPWLATPRELESSGLVISRKHAGVLVRALADKEMADPCELRGLRDAHAANLAFHRAVVDAADHEALAALRPCLPSMSRLPMRA